MGPEGGEEDSDRDSGNEEEAVEAAAGGAAAPVAAEAGGGEAAPAVGAEGGAVIEADVNHAILDHDQVPLRLLFGLSTTLIFPYRGTLINEVPIRPWSASTLLI